MRIHAVVPAAGSGERMGASCSKVFLKLGGVSVLRRTVVTLRECSKIGKIVVAVQDQDVDLARQDLSGVSDIDVITGGATRKESVFKGLAHLNRLECGSEPTFVLIHDAARCLLGTALLERVIEAAYSSGAVTAALPLTDSLKRGNAEGLISASLDRRDLWLIQTPQAFKLSLLYKAHLNAGPDEATDDAALVEPHHPVRLVLGEKTNIKLTTPEDLQVAEALLAAGLP